MPLVLQQLGAEVKFSNMYLMQILSLWVLCLVWLIQRPIKVSLVQPHQMRPLRGKECHLPLLKNVQDLFLISRMSYPFRLLLDFLEFVTTM